MEKADTLENVYKTLDPKPLESPDEIKAYYRKELNEVRGRDVAARMKLGLRRAARGQSYKALLMGHAGVGKSTELTRLMADMADLYQPIRFSVSRQLDPVSFQPFDVLLLMVSEIAERTAAPRERGGAGAPPPDAMLQKVWDWFVQEKSTRIERNAAEIALSAGAGVAGESLWAKTLGLFAQIKGEMKFASQRERQLVDYRLSRLDQLIDAANQLMRACNDALYKECGQEWLFLGEDFDKAGVSPECTEKLFVSYANALRDLDCHFIFTIPISLGYSSKADSLPTGVREMLPDTQVFDQQHEPDARGRDALRKVLEARLAPDLFAAGQMDRLIVASGGNLRNLFKLSAEAADNAILRGAGARGPIKAQDVNPAIAMLRTDYERRLGQSPYDVELVAGKPEPIPYDKKAERLLTVYEGKAESQVPDAVLYALLRARAVQEFNGKRWFGVHPLVVDILAAQQKFPTTPDGKIKGGSE